MSEPSAVATNPQHPAADPLSGLWAEGLRGPVRPLGLPEPELLPVALALFAPTKPAAPDQDAPPPLEAEPRPEPSREPPPEAVAAAPIALLAPPVQEPSFPEPGLAAAPPEAFAAEPEPVVFAPAEPAPAEPAPVVAAVAAPEPAVEPPASSTASGDPEFERWLAGGHETLGTPDAAPAVAAEAAAPALDLAAPSPAEAAWETPADAAPAIPPEAPPAGNEVWSARPAEAASAPPVPVDEVWSAPPPAADEPAAAASWNAAAPDPEWQTVEQVEAPAAATGIGADWDSVGGPDWSAPPDAAAAPEAAWTAAPAAGADGWAAAPDAPTWEAPAAPASDAPDAAWEAARPPPEPGAPWSARVPSGGESWDPSASTPQWSAAEASAAPDSPGWTAPPAGPSALEQLESEPLEAEPGAAGVLFSSLPPGASLGGDDTEGLELREIDAETAMQNPKDAPRLPLQPSADEDPDLLVPLEDAPPAPRITPSAPLAAVQTVNPLRVEGEHRVTVHTRGGRTHRGTVQDIDLNKPSFQLSPQGGGEPETMYNSDVKAVFFMLAPGEKPGPPDGGRVRVTFADGRVVEGTRDGLDAKAGFFLVPQDAARTNTRRIYVVREATSDIRDL